MINHYKKGITLVEVVIVVVTLGIIFAVVIPQLSKVRENQVLKSSVSDVISSLNKAQAQTLASVNSFSYGVHFQSDKVIIFRGMVFSAGDSNNEAIDIVSPANISNVTLAGVSGSSGSLYFNRLSGAPNQNGTITISTSSYSKIITISVTGAVSVN